jgi:hypothetical protein
VDPEVLELTSAAARQVVTLLVTDAWEQVRGAVARLWQRVHPDRAETVEAELAQARDELLTARDAGDEQVAQALRAEWQGRLWRLLAADPDLTEAVRRLAAGDLGPPGEAATYGPVTMRARVSDGGSVYQAGRDQSITIRTNQGDQPPAG